MEAYQTQNLALAVTLATCGVPFYEADGQHCPVLNIYSAETIRAMKDRHGLAVYKGWTLEKAAEHAWKNGREGRVVFCFKWTPDLSEIVKAYNAQHAALDAPESPGEPLDVAPAIAAKLACQLLHNRKMLRDAWKRPTPLIAVSGNTQTEDRNGAKVTTGSVKLMSLNASKETRNKLKL